MRDAARRAPRHHLHATACSSSLSFAAASSSARAALTSAPAAAPTHDSSQWNLYQKVLHGNYLCHAGLYTAVTAHFQQLAAAAPPPPRRALRILDLGCGDAHCISGALAASGLGPRVARYTGVDMSSAAVSIARGNVTAALAAPSAPAAAAGAAAVVEFVETDMLGCLESLAPGSYDLVFASLAAHHLPDEQKGELVGLVARALAPGGQFLLVDIFFAPGEQEAAGGVCCDCVDECVAAAAGKPGRFRDACGPYCKAVCGQHHKQLTQPHTHTLADPVTHSLHNQVTPAIRTSSALRPTSRAAMRLSHRRRRAQSCTMVSLTGFD